MNLCKLKSVSKTTQLFDLCGRNFHTAVIYNNGNSNKTYYEILRVPKNASQTEIKEAYYKLSKVYHPDIAKDESSHVMFRNISEAYNTLSNLKARKAYDITVAVPGDYDATKQPFYTSLFKDSLHKGVRGFPEKSAFKKQTFYDRWMDETYNRRFVEKKYPFTDITDPEREPFARDEAQRIIFMTGICIIIAIVRLADYYYELCKPLE